MKNVIMLHRKKLADYSNEFVRRFDRLHILINVLFPLQDPFPWVWKRSEPVLTPDSTLILNIGASPNANKSVLKKIANFSYVYWD